MNHLNDADDLEPLDLSFHRGPEPDSAISGDAVANEQGLGRALRAMTRARAARRRRRLAGLLMLAIAAGWLVWPRVPPRPAPLSDPAALLAQDDPESNASGVEPSTRNPEAERGMPTQAPTDSSVSMPRDRAARPTVRLVETGFAAGRFAPQARSRPATIRLDDESILTTLDQAGLPAVLRCVERDAARCSVQLLASDR